MRSSASTVDTSPLTVWPMDTLFGLPAHPLLVHIPIVLLPLAAVGVVVMAIRQSWLRQFRWVVLALGAAGTFGAVLAASAGESLEHRITSVEGRAAASSWQHHAELGDTARTVAIVFLVLLAAYVLGTWWMERTSSTRRWLSIGLTVLALGGAVASVYTVVQAGHTGSKSVWEDYMKDKSSGG